MPPRSRQEIVLALSEHRRALEGVHLRDLFAADRQRFDKFSLEAAGLFLDYAKHRITDATLPLLLELARSAGLEARRDAMFRGERINVTEDRSVLHTALRNRGSDPLMVDGSDVLPQIRTVLEQMAGFCRAIRSGALTGATGQRIDAVVNIGIGGSDLGPVMVCEALEPLLDGPRPHFVSNVDGAHLGRLLKTLDPERTLFIVASKTFTTQETLANARSARAWLAARLGEAAVGRHFCAVSTNLEATASFGIGPERVFAFWDWVGGRYSLWSAIGLSIMLAAGPERFDGLLAGAWDMDCHFRNAPIARNMPVLMGLIGVWYVNFWDVHAQAVLPYDQGLHRLPAYLQQLDMESNGKRTALDGTPLTYATGPIIWGEPGTNGQHAFYQHLHQGTGWTPADFILPLHSHYPMGEHHAMLVANCLAQSQALMQGKDAAQVRAELAAQGVDPARAEELLPHRLFPGNRPSSTLVLDRITPHSLGALIALYEHKVFVQGTLWGINSFDQWGVELGKQLAGHLLRDMGAGAPEPGVDASTAGLLRRYLGSLQKTENKAR